ncbi:hypothetical protein BN1708_017188, partial [Verticillium longisporum]
AARGCPVRRCGRGT